RALYWLAVVLPDRVTKPLIQVIEYLMHVLSIVISSKQALPHEAFRDPARRPLVEAAAPDHTIKDRQNPDQDLDVPALHRVRHGDSRIISHDTTMPTPTVCAFGRAGCGRLIVAIPFTPAPPGARRAAPPARGPQGSFDRLWLDYAVGKVTCREASTNRRKALADGRPGLTGEVE